MPYYKILAVTIFLFFSFSKAQELKKIVEKYVDPNTDNSARYDLGVEIKKNFVSSELKSVLSSPINDEKKRKYALELATEMNVVGLDSVAKKHIDSEDFMLVVKYLLTTQNEDITKFLFERWKKLEVDSASFTLLNTAFQTYNIDLNCIERFKNFIKLENQEKRKESAIKILLFQMSVANEKEIFEKWNIFEKKYKQYSYKFLCKGIDLAERGVQTENAKKIVTNFLLKPGCRISFANFPKHINKGNFVIKVRILIISGSDAKVGITVGQGAWSARLNKENEWIVKTGDDKEFARVQVKKEQWSEIVFNIKDESTEKVRYDRDISITVDGILILENGSCNGLFEKVEIRTENAELVVGGVELIK